MKLKLIFSFLFLSMLCGINTYSQTTLSAGDVALTGFKTDNPDQFVFVLLTDVTAGTQINFTDRGWNSTLGTFRAGEGVLTWTATSSLSAGTVIDVLDLENPFTADNGTITDDSNFQLAASGDQILVYQGTDASPIFLNAIHMDGGDGGWSNASGSNSTALPPGLTDGVHAVYFGEIDNGSFICPTDPFEGTADSLLAEIMDISNWELENGPFNITTTLGGGCSINVSPNCTDPVVSGSNTIYGNVFNDYNFNGTHDAGEPLESNITLNLYEDTNANGVIDGADSIIQTTISDASGNYNFSIIPAVATGLVFSKRIDRGVDDAQQEGNNKVVLDGNELKFKIGDPYIGLRFRNVTIPQGAVINSATVKFLSKDDQTGSLSYEISIEDSDDAAEFIDTDNNISNRWDASNIVDWHNMPNWDELNIYPTPDVSPLIQSVVNRPGWSSGNNLALLFGHFAGPSAERKTQSYEKIGSQASLLEINYDGITPASYIVQIDQTTLPASSSLSTGNLHAVSFNHVDEVKCEKNFGFFSPCTDPSGLDSDGDGINDSCDLDDDNDGILDTDECSDLGKAPLLNSDFEDIDITTGLDGGPSDVVATSGIWKGDASNIPHWLSSDATNNHLEIWHNSQTAGNDSGGLAFSGTQWAEVNATTNDGLYQDITTTPGDVLNWSFAHRKRTGYAGSAGEDIVRLLIGNPSGTLTSQGDFSSAGDASWTEHSGTYTVPAGQTTTRLTFTAIAVASGGGTTSGNFVDKVQLYVLPNCEDSDGDGVDDYLDLDSDNDGIPDNIEAQSTIGYIAPSGAGSGITDVDQNGIDDNFGLGLALEDTDGDGIPDFRDLDSDNDGLLDIEENGMADLIVSFTDIDSDGLDNLFEGSNLNDPNDVNDEIDDPTDLSVLPDGDGDLLSGGDLDYRDLFNINPPASAALDFDGIDDYAEVNSVINGLSEYTVSLWVKYNGPTLGTNDDVFVMGQKDVFEITIKNWSPANNPTHYSLQGKVFYDNSSFLGVASGWKSSRSDWTHIAVKVRQNGPDVQAKVFRNGFASSSWLSLPGTLSNNSEPLRLGIVSGTNSFEYNFEGWMDEVRIFDVALTDDQIQRMVYQEIENNAGFVHGSVIPKDIVDINTNAKIPWSNLIAYYPFTNIKTNTTADLSNNDNELKLYNISSILEQTAPMPFETSSDGDWTEESTWLHGDVWDIENLPNFAIPSQSPEAWCIVHLHDNVTTSNSHKGIGLLIDNDKELTVNNDNEINNSWYLQLDGTLDLKNDSQLIQTVNSDLVTSATGKILRRQEGTSSPFRYNYWGSPVGALGATSLTDNNAVTNNTNNSSFSLNMLKDERENNMLFTSNYTANGNISTYWLYTFKNGKTYWDWKFLNPNDPLTPGVGYTQKGTGLGDSEQQYIFEGKPNNGTILIDVADVGGPGSVANHSKTEYLLANPYPSAIDVHQFIDDNVGVIDGYLQLWQQWGGDSHNLSEYEGGYAQVNKTGSIRAYQFVGFYGDNTGSQDGCIVPTRYLPVGQGFIAEIVADGQVEFNNSQRVFIKESDADGTYDNGSAFSKTTNGKGEKTETASKTAEEENPMQRIRLEFNSVKGTETRRELLLGFSDFTTDSFDYGFDAKNTETSSNDLNLVLEGQNMNIQAYGPITTDKVVPLNFKSSGDNSFEIRITDTENLDESQEIYIKDNLTGVYFDLTQDAAYSFSSEQGIFNNRFEIVFQSEQQSLSIEESMVSENYIYYQNTTNTLFVKKLNSAVSKLSLVNMRGQIVLELLNVSTEQLKNGIPFSNIATGAYVVCMRTEANEVLTKKIIIN
ncbi:LamG-like jellyroll fold domain-containing protein [Algibacter luteus]|uniref:LamG-like jellyroll fold domain-containing protein n=1 Tax=Algibacter luteus TaxID=1178825 RepID=UPI00259A5FE5|nr:LamG-like jellyroll fold domain-containing protein [Algibacter luteus]WJJ97245.1 T9SS type A sorting domain-containing protein [Algibacter luteus]